MNKLNKKIFNKVLVSLFTVFVLSGCAFGINLEYKNSLSSVELSKNSDGSYTVNLYTSKKFLDPIKVIKKNDLNYYILLPETKNSSGTIASNNSDIRNITTNSYSYAGQDVNNGYTKINIMTNKPLTFNVSVKSSQYNTGGAAAAKIPPLPVEEKVVQKKVTQEVKKQKESDKIKINEETKKAETKTQKEAIKADKVGRVNQIDKIEKVEKTENKVQKTKPILEEAIANNYDEEDYKGDLSQKEEQKAQVSEEIINDFETVLQNEGEQERDLRYDSLNQEENNYDFKKYITEIGTILKKACTLLNRLGINIIGLVIMMASGVFVFFAVLYTLTRKPKQTPRIKSKIDLLDKNNVPEKPFNSKNDEYFVLGNVKQSVFFDPASSAIKRNYELSSYDSKCANREKLKRTKINKEKSNDEYDIIQKILSEDSVVELSSSEYDVMNNPSNIGVMQKQNEILAEQIKKEDINVKQNDIVTSPIIKEDKKLEVKVPTTTEPFMISKAEISPEKGFMLVTYDDNISLVGYIFDDVFALYNFKCSKLENYEITYRIADKDEYGTNYIIKVDSVRLMVRVGKTSMKMRIVL